ncbi:MAG: hypothetical protein II117_05065 [Clostridia bacterium]|nr:hypothetical protein [Clostridia bacterium]
MMEFLIIAGALVFAAVLLIPAILRRNKIQKNGVEKDAVISRIEKKWVDSNEGGSVIQLIYYVTYVNQDGQTVEAQLLGVPEHAREGDRVRIKYLPEKPHFAILMK